MKSLREITNQYSISGDVKKFEALSAGLINDTYALTFEDPVGDEVKFIFQKINTDVFKNPQGLMQNIAQVTKHISQKSELNIKQGLSKNLRLINTATGAFYAQDSQGAMWRCYNYIANSKTHSQIANTKLAYQTAYAFGNFIDCLHDMPVSKISTSIPDFHNTEKYYNKLLEAYKKDPLGRAKELSLEIEAVSKKQNTIALINNLIKKNLLPIRITHNDTKITNILFDEKSDEALCVIDLDTTMQGVSLYDFGDLVRSSISLSQEDEKNLNAISIRLPIFKALARGFIDGCKILTAEEMHYLSVAGKCITLENAIRFMTDYLLGDVYFKTAYPEHNLDRARHQLQLLSLLEENENKFVDILNKIIATKKST